MASHQKAQIALRYWLQGAGYFEALKAMEYASRFHVGKRKDGVTPEFDHQIRIASYVRTLSGLSQPEVTLTCVFLHDVVEDYNVSPEEIGHRFGSSVQEVTWRLTKTYQGVSKSTSSYYDDLARCPVASVAKAADRIHNVSSMVGVFSPDKQAAYVVETNQFVMPMLKVARRAFPSQEPAYENAKTVLSTQLGIISSLAPSP